MLTSGSGTITVTASFSFSDADDDLKSTIWSVLGNALNPLQSEIVQHGSTFTGQKSGSISFSFSVNTGASSKDFVSVTVTVTDNKSNASNALSGTFWIL